MPEQEKNLYSLPSDAKALADKEQARKEAEIIEKKAKKIADGEKIEKEDYEEVEKEVEKEESKKEKFTEKEKINEISNYYYMHFYTREDCVKQLKKIPVKLHKAIFFKVIEIAREDNNNLEAIEGMAERINDFHPESHKEIILKLLEAGVGGVGGLGEMLYDYPKKLDEEVALQLIIKGFDFDIVENIDKFPKMAHEKIAVKLCEMGKLELVIRNESKFSDFDYSLTIPAYPSGTTVGKLSEIVKMPQIGYRFYKSLHNLTSFSFPNQIKPIINAQGEAAFLYFESIKKIKDYQNLSAEDTDYITHIAKKYGTQARNILDNILTKVDSISGERETIEEFIQDIGIIHFDIYKQYKQAKEENNQEKIIELKERVKELHNKIYQGEMEKKILIMNFIRLYLITHSRQLWVLPKINMKD